MDWTGVELVSWDLDGTLYDNDAFWTAFHCRVRSRLRFGQFWRTIQELWLLHRFRRWVAYERRRGGCLGPKPAALNSDSADVILDSWITGCIADAGRSDGVVDVMNALSSRGIRQVIVTDLRCMGKLEALELPQCIEQVYEGETLGFIKPHHELFSIVLADSRIRSEAVVHIGDRADTDAPAAQHHGIKCLLKGVDFTDFPSLFATLS